MQFNHPTKQNPAHGLPIPRLELENQLNLSGRRRLVLPASFRGGPHPVGAGRETDKTGPQPSVSQPPAGRFDGERLTMQVMGKNFAVAANGDIVTDIHINHWVAIPALNYILHTKGSPVMGRWASFRELREGRERYPLFQKRCEEPMKRVADSYASLFDDMVHILGGSQVAEQFKADISVVLHPLPKVPVMICYWLPDDGLRSSLYVFFDETANENLDIGSVFMLATGLAQMFTKMGLTHGFPAAGPGR